MAELHGRRVVQVHGTGAGSGAIGQNRVRKHADASIRRSGRGGPMLMHRVLNDGDHKLGLHAKGIMAKKTIDDIQVGGKRVLVRLHAPVAGARC